MSYQLKILTTALFSVALLNKLLSGLQWLSLILLMIGVAVVQLQPTQATPATEQSLLIGLSSIGAASMMSGFAGVYFEKLLKHTSPSIFLRNVQLGVIGIVFGLVAMYVNDGPKVFLTDLYQYSLMAVASYYKMSLMWFNSRWTEHQLHYILPG